MGTDGIKLFNFCPLQKSFIFFVAPVVVGTSFVTNYLLCAGGRLARPVILFDALLILKGK